MSLIVLRDPYTKQKRIVHIYSNLSIDVLVVPLYQAIRCLINIDALVDNNTTFGVVLRKQLLGGNIATGKQLVEFINNVCGGRVEATFHSNLQAVVDLRTLRILKRSHYRFSKHSYIFHTSMLEDDPCGGLQRKTRHYNVYDTTNKIKLREHVLNCLWLMFYEDLKGKLEELFSILQYVRFDKEDWQSIIFRYINPDRLTIKLC
jgi:hypothetical protein